jgi:hypothetical protein
LLSWIRFFDGYEQRKEEKRHSRSWQTTRGLNLQVEKVSTNLAHSEGEEEIKRKEKTVPCRKWDTVNGYRRKSIMGGDHATTLLTKSDLASTFTHFLYSWWGVCSEFKTKQALEIPWAQPNTVVAYRHKLPLPSLAEEFKRTLVTGIASFYERRTWKLRSNRLGTGWGKVLLNQVLHAASQGYWQTKCNLLTNHEQQTKKTRALEAKTTKKIEKKLKVNQVIHYQPERGWIHKIPTPHWDFIGWRKVAAKTCHGSHVPLCKEGMMLHVWWAYYKTALLTTIPLTSIWG